MSYHNTIYEMTNRIEAQLKRLADSLERIEQHLKPEHQLAEFPQEFPYVVPVDMPEHRVKDYVYETARRPDVFFPKATAADREPPAPITVSQAVIDPKQLGYEGAFGRGPLEPPAHYKRLPQGESCPEGWVDAQGNSWCPHGTQQLQPGVTWNLSMSSNKWVSSRHAHTRDDRTAKQSSVVWWT